MLVVSSGPRGPLRATSKPPPAPHQRKQSLDAKPGLGLPVASAPPPHRRGRYARDLVIQSEADRWALLARMPSSTNCNHFSRSGSTCVTLPSGRLRRRLKNLPGAGLMSCHLHPRHHPLGFDGRTAGRALCVPSIAICQHLMCSFNSCHSQRLSFGAPVDFLYW